MLSQKALLRQTSSYKKIGIRLKLTKKRKKYCNTSCYHTLRLEKSISNNILIILLKSKRVGVLQILTISPDCTLYGAAKRFLDM